MFPFREHAADSIAYAFSYTFNGVSEPAYRSPAFMGAATSTFGGLGVMCRLGVVCRLGVMRGLEVMCGLGVVTRLGCRDMGGCLRICGTCWYGYRDHSTVLCRFKLVPVGAV